MNIFYGTAELELSDHRPITGLFEAKIKVIDSRARQALIDEISEKFFRIVELNNSNDLKK